VQIAGPAAALDDSDRATVLLPRSTARRAVRLLAFALDETALTGYFDKIIVPDVPAGEVRVLLGDFGSGKSETAESWHRAAIRRLTDWQRPPLPLWLDAADVAARTLEEAIEQRLGPTWRQGRGASIVVDGLDQTDPATAQAVLVAARTLSRTYTNVQFLLTARPGILAPTQVETIQAQLLEEDDALELVELAGGKPHAVWRWTANMRATVTRPFFALAAADLLGRAETVRGEADLIRGLVENALARATERAAVTSTETRAVLQNLAVMLTRAQKDTLSFADRQIARDSRLVADAPEDKVLFALPIFQQWFAAQAILNKDVAAAEIVADSNNFTRWRWAAAVAALSARNPVEVDDLLASWIAGNPGAAAWVIEEAFSGYRDWREETDENVDRATSGARLLRAFRTWCDALGPLAQGVLPYPVVRGPFELGVSVAGRRVSIGFSTAEPDEDSVRELPVGVHPLAPDAVAGWLPSRSGIAPQGDAWPWTIVRTMIAKSTAKRLARDPNHGTSDGVWAQEHRYDVSRRLLNLGSLAHADLPAVDVRERADNVFAAIGHDADAVLDFDGLECSAARLEELIAYCDAPGTTHVPSHLPDRDLAPSTGRFIWDPYSAGRLMEFEAEVYGRACEAYDEALAHTFSSLDWSMSSSAFAPFGVLLELKFDDDGAKLAGAPPGLTVMRMPTAVMPGLVPDGPDVVWSTNGRAVIKQDHSSPAPDLARHYKTLEIVRAWLAERDIEPLGGLGWMQTGADDMRQARPASNIAAHWLWNDLKDVGLGEGSFPQVR
jgi:hypothetical protein